MMQRKVTDELGLTPVQRITHHLTCLFETGVIDLNFGAVENLGAGQGYSCGWAGFTTAGENVVAVVEEYTRLAPLNTLLHFLSWLQYLRDAGSDDVSQLGLRDFESHWQNAATDDKFKRAYSTVVEKKLGWPAQAHIEHLGLRLPAASAILFDAGMQHGWGKGVGGVPVLLDWVCAGRTVEFSERADTWFLERFLYERAELLKILPESTVKGGKEGSLARIETLRQLLKSNPSLTMPIKVNWKGEEYAIELP